MSNREQVASPVAATIERIGRKVRVARAERGLSIEDVAFAAKTSPGRVGALERGQDRVRIDTLARVCDVVGLQVTLEVKAEVA